MNGLAWRYMLPPDLIGAFSINLLEFIASAITIHLSLAASSSPQKILAYTDSSSALGWLYKASFSSSMPAHDKVARWLALELMSYDSALYSQHIRGRHNIIADSLSRDHYLSITQLTNSFLRLYPDQTPPNFRILPLPEKNRLMAALAQSFIDQESGVAPATMQKQIGCFDRWIRFLSDMGIEDEWLSQYRQDQRIYLLSAFAGSCRRNEYGTTRKSILRGKTVKSTITNVRSAFRSNLRPDPALDPDMKCSLFLTRQFSG